MQFLNHNRPIENIKDFYINIILNSSFPAFVLSFPLLENHKSFKWHDNHSISLNAEKKIMNYTLRAFMWWYHTPAECIKEKYRIPPCLPSVWRLLNTGETRSRIMFSLRVQALRLYFVYLIYSTNSMNNHLNFLNRFFEVNTIQTSGHVKGSDTSEILFFLFG